MSYCQLCIAVYRAVWKSRWPTWAVCPDEPYGFRWCKAILNHAHALVSACPWYVSWLLRTLSNTGILRYSKRVCSSMLAKQFVADWSPNDCVSWAVLFLMDCCVYLLIWHNGFSPHCFLLCVWLECVPCSFKIMNSNDCMGVIIALSLPKPFYLSNCGWWVRWVVCFLFTDMYLWFIYTMWGDLHGLLNDEPRLFLSMWNRQFPEITDKDNLTVFSYSRRVTSPEWRRQMRRADLQQF